MTGAHIVEKMPPAEESDGRRRRSQDSRTRIIYAMLDLVGEGDPAPGAERVAERAQVGLRTVFRHFKDMDSLYREMSDHIAGELRSLLDQPFQAASWRDRVLELVGRRGAVYEKIAPFKRASDIFRNRSRFLESDHVMLTTAAREILLREIPVEAELEPVIVEALDLLLSYEAWSRLRREQGLSSAQAVGALQAAVERMLA